MTIEPNQPVEPLTAAPLPEEPRPPAPSFEDLFGAAPASVAEANEDHVVTQVEAEDLVLESFSEQPVAVTEGLSGEDVEPGEAEAAPLAQAVDEAPNQMAAEASTAAAVLGPVSVVTEPQVALHLNVTANSDIGCVRTNNEDSFGYDPAHGLYIVCDGMGGMASGEIASSMAVSTALSTFAGSADSGQAVGARLQQAIHAANQAVWDFGQQPEHRGMGTTLVAIAQDGDSLIVGNVGDSRAYMVKSGRCMQITVDHSYINELIRNGTLALENAHNVDLKGMESVITRAIGAGPTVEPDFFSIQPHPSDMVLLASDGLTRYLNQDEILQVLAASEFTNAPQTLIGIAKQRGGVDNITCLLVQAG